ncbi:MAG: 4-alpha-glucanotransferase [Dehalococcoidia bacterium]|nr:4-alpha-glucanotransferase [Dehalococcoidia bacterium]
MTAQDHEDALVRLAEFHGVAAAYEDFRGAPRRVSTAVLRAVLAALGALGAEGDDATQRLRDSERARWSEIMEPVAVAWDGRGALDLRLPAGLRPSHIEVALTSESGERRHLEVPVGRARITRRIDVNAQAFVVRRLSLPRLALGYHEVALRLSAGASTIEGRGLVIAAPRQAYRPPDARPAAGVFAPLYSLHSERSAGIGNLGDLRRLLDWARALGGATVGTLPLLATYHDDPRGVSPYSPISRVAWDELFLDLRALPEAASPRAATLLRGVLGVTPGPPGPYVDYAAVDRALAPVLDACALEAWQGPRRADLERFARARPDLEAYARFRGARTHLGADWRDWPAAARDGVLADADVDADTYRLHLYAQCALDAQLGDLAGHARNGGRGLYLDLPLGTHREGFDAWRYADSFADALDTGAPPDSLFIGGQNWQFAPPHPEAARRNGYEYFRASVRAHLRFAGVLRVDHVMGLHRLYVIPRNASASEGTYVHQHPDEAWAILCLESHRARATVIGEDLGTVPAAVRGAMRRHHVGGSYVVQYEASPQRRRTLPPPPRLAAASPNTHDMPTFEGWSAGRDIELLRELGYAEESHAALEERASLVSALARFLGVADADRPRLLRACLDWLGRSEADLVLVSLDDLLGARDAQNLPGTTHEHPNWRRRARLSLEELADDSRAAELLAALSAARATR